MLKISFQDAFQTTTSQGQIKVGQTAVTPDGNTWVYGKAGGAIAWQSFLQEIFLHKHPSLQEKKF